MLAATVCLAGACGEGTSSPSVGAGATAATGAAPTSGGAIAGGAGISAGGAAGLAGHSASGGAEPIVTAGTSGSETGGMPSALMPRPKPANIVFILSDDHRNDILGTAGHPLVKTPNIDAMATQGVRFTNAFVTTPICAASRASLFTGLTERTHGYTFGTPPFTAGHAANSYPARLRAAGYRTGFFGKFGVKTEANTTTMFDVFRDFDRPYFQKDGAGRTVHITNMARDLALDFLASQPKDQPFALQVSFSAPHANDDDHSNLYPPAPEEASLYAQLSMPVPRLGDPAIFEAQPPFLKTSLNRQRYFWGWDTPEKYQKNMRGYLQLVSGVDRVVGDIRAKLSELGLAENTVIVLMGDNGDYLGDRGFDGKWSHYEESLRVPLVIYDPLAPSVERAQAATALNVDVPATILNLAGATIPGTYQGASLVSYLGWKEAPPVRADFFCEHHFDDDSLPKWEGVRSEAFKYAIYYEQSPAYEMLHDLNADPDELVNLAGSAAHAQDLAAMRAKLASYKQEYPPAPSLK